MSTAISIDDLTQMVGQSVGTSDWMLIDQAMIDRFADVTHDHQFIHVDPKRAAEETPFGGTIAHGFLTLSLLSHLSQQVRPTIQHSAMGINYGFDQVRFINPVVCGQRVRGEFTLARVEPRNDTQILCEYTVTVSIEDQAKPALVAKWLNLIVLSAP